MQPSAADALIKCSNVNGLKGTNVKRGTFFLVECDEAIDGRMQKLITRK